MVESCVIPKTRERWIVLPHSRDQHAWRYVIGAELDKNASRDGSAYRFTENVAEALASGADHDSIAAIISMVPPGDPAFLADPDTRHAEVAQRTRLASDLIRLRPDRVFGPTHFHAGAVELFSGLTVAAPKAPAVTPYETALALALESFGSARRSAIWRRDLFSYPTPPMANEPPYTFDLTGRPKFLVFGPYLTMPPGTWTARFGLTFDAPSTRHRYRADWGGVTEYQSIEFRPERPGRYQIELTHEWTEAAPCELRLLSMEGVFEGRVTFSGAEVGLAAER